MKKNNALGEKTGAQSVGTSDLLADALRAVMKLVDDEDLVRNTENDADVMAFMRQGIRITSALKKAQEALASASEKVERPAPLEK